MWIHLQNASAIRNMLMVIQRTNAKLKQSFSIVFWLNYNNNWENEIKLKNNTANSIQNALMLVNAEIEEKTMLIKINPMKNA